MATSMSQPNNRVSFITSRVDSRRATGHVAPHHSEKLGGHRPCTLLSDSSCVQRVLGSECVTAVVHTVDPVYLGCYPG